MCISNVSKGLLFQFRVSPSVFMLWHMVSLVRLHKWSGFILDHCTCAMDMAHLFSLKHCFIVSYSNFQLCFSDPTHVAYNPVRPHSLSLVRYHDYMRAKNNCHCLTVPLPVLYSTVYVKPGSFSLQLLYSENKCLE